jgi:hypothetical protein
MEKVDSNVGAVGAIMELHRKVKLRAGLLNRLGGVVVKAGLSVFLFDEIKPVGGGVLEKIWGRFRDQSRASLFRRTRAKDQESDPEWA